MLQSIGAIAAVIYEVIVLGVKAYNLYAEAKRKGWVKDGQTINQAINSAKTDEERSALARRLFEHRAE